MKTKNTLKKGADPSVIIGILKKNNLNEFNEDDLKEKVKKEYSNYFSRTSLDTYKANVREEIIINNQKRRFLIKLPQDLRKVDIMACHYDNEKDIIVISLVQQKGNNASFNSSSESKTLECMSNCFIDKTYIEYFDKLPDHLNPKKNGKNYVVDLSIGMVNAVGGKSKIKNGVKINYYSNDDYLSYLGLDIDIIELSMLIDNNEKIMNHSYDAVNDCKNWDTIYNKCLNRVLKYGNK